MPHNRYNNKSLLWMDAGNCQKDLKKFSKEEGKKGGGGVTLATKEETSRGVAMRVF